MTQSKKVLACDLGASSGRAILGSFDGQKIDLEVLHKFSNGGTYLNNDFHWDTLKQYNEIKAGIKKAIKKTSNQLDSVGIDTWGVDYGLLDENGTLMSVPYHYRDQRTEGLMEEVFKKISKAEIYRETGIQFMELNTIFQLFADLKNRPWIIDNAEDLLFTPDLLNYFLTGKKFNEYTIASTSQLYNPLKDKWSEKIYNKLNLPESMMQQIIRPGEKVGDILQKVKAECGIRGELPVIAVGSHDTASAVAAAPLKDENSAYLSSGTWSLLGMELDQPIITEESLAANFTNELGVGNKVRFLKNITGLWLIQECKRIWDRRGMNLSYSDITEAAEAAEPFKYSLDPDHHDFVNPDNMPEAIKNYCRETGQPVPEEPGEMARGIYESLAQNYKEVIEKLEKLTDKKIETLNMVGGGIQAEILCQYTANISKRRVVTGPIEATAIGNILTQLMALGEIASLEEGREIVRNSVELKEYLPE
ncbi:rhamnulokinase family protein [Halanaerobium sp. ST460_2HS_T2]|uniref:rhamnulokinase n=1 Tax=Halanaerobium sp. ST460_2HS_T2 TaxID=2183914 RepID=UPI000DF4BA19|nr:rhamnulokinase family protein [Halanaerobium sp. ST460_2HS_T2]RCW61058.1 rhamnulokinase [Halanaerobium sp. ST460_2HS_T2]